MLAHLRSLTTECPVSASLYARASGARTTCSKNVKELAELFGWRYWHIHDSRRQVRREGHGGLRGRPRHGRDPGRNPREGAVAHLRGAEGSRNKWPTDEQWTALYELQDVAEANPYVEVYLLHSTLWKRTYSSSRTS